MDRGTYSSASLGLAALRKLEIVNNNIANVNTVGFKREIITTDSQAFDQTLASQIAKDDPYAEGDHQRTPGVVNFKTVTDFSPGPVKSTGNPLDIALVNPKDFLMVNTPEGVQYTRAGSLTLNAEGELVTPDGMQVLGDGGALTANGPKASIADDGTLRVNGVSAGRLAVVRFDDTSGLEHAGGTRFRLKDGAPAPTNVAAELVPASVEMANVSLVSSMVELITANRGFQAYTKAAETADQMNNVSINQYGRPRA